MIMIVLLIISFSIVLVTIWIKRKNIKTGSSKDPDYRALFILGITFLPMGLVMTITVDNPGFYGITALGIVFLITGLAHKDEWRN